jgi:hypothetical protein
MENGPKAAISTLILFKPIGPLEILIGGISESNGSALKKVGNPAVSLGSDFSLHSDFRVRNEAAKV